MVMVNFATEDDAVSQTLDLPTIPLPGMEIEFSGLDVYTVVRTRYIVGDTSAWCLIEPGEGGGGKKPKKPHPFKK